MSSKYRQKQEGRISSFQRACKGPALDRIQRSSQTICSSVEGVTYQLIEELLPLSRHDLMSAGAERLCSADIKALESMAPKIDRQYGGDSRKLPDGCRIQFYTHSIPELQRLAERLQKMERRALRDFDPNISIRQDTFGGLKKIRLMGVEDENGNVTIKPIKYHIEKPKERGWMGIILKLEYKRKGHWHPFEIQFFPREMKKAYEESHSLYSGIKEDIEEWEAYCNIYDKIHNPTDEAAAWRQNSKTFFRDYANYRDRKGHTPVAVYLLNIRPQIRPNIPIERNRRVLNTLNEMLNIHYEAVVECGLHTLLTEEFPSVQSTLARAEGTEEIEPLTGYTKPETQAPKPSTTPTQERTITEPL